jgi:hypothetical protein
MSEPQSSSAFQSTLESQSTKIVDQAQSRGIILRLIGALGIRMHSPTAGGASFGRSLTDIDFVGYLKQRKQIEKFFTDLGYKPNESFNNVHGHSRMIFYNMEQKFQVDVFLDMFEMCHTIDFRGRLELDTPTVPLPELLASKLQIVELNEKDAKDMLAIFNDHDLSDNDSDRDRINTKYLAKMCSSDWGKYKTFTMNLEKITGFAPKYLADGSVATDRIKRTVASIEAEPKTTGWKMRAKIGERKRWYNLPDLPRTSLAEQSNSSAKAAS